MFSLTSPTMRSRRLESCLPTPTRIHADACNDAGDPESMRDASQSGERRGRRRRFALVTPAENERAQTGSIAVSFAIVSRSRWPR
ncbi:hypothetical protein [Paraburkholderia sp. J12]|uniref:hypothetical protein n=1 Tax=Paraburkholderia sp. J12 TaxID=2805432 RepID=UPI002ABD4FF9|nr:hypothetical protein [Paraburkholderia sp. J12]